MVETYEGMAWWMFALALVFIGAIFAGALRWVKAMKTKNKDFRFRQLFTQRRRGNLPEEPR